MQTSYKCPFSFKDFMLNLNQKPQEKYKKKQNLFQLNHLTNDSIDSGKQELSARSTKLKKSSNQLRFYKYNRDEQQQSRDLFTNTLSKYHSPQIQRHNLKFIISSPNSSRKYEVIIINISQEQLILRIEQLNKKPIPLFKQLLIQRKIDNNQQKFSQIQSIKKSNFLSSLLLQRKKCPVILNQQENQINFDSDPLFDKLFLDAHFSIIQNKEETKSIHKTIFNQIVNKQIHLGNQQLLSKHRCLYIQKKHFNLIKHFVINQLLELKVSAPQLFAICSTLESIKTYLLNEEPLYNQIGKEKGIQKIANQLYQKIFQDIILNEYFKNISLEEQVILLQYKIKQAIKFSKLLGQLLNTINSPNYSLYTLRERHLKYQLTHIHFANFKLYLSIALQENMVPSRIIKQILSTTDGFKCAIINKDSIKDIIEHRYPGGFDGFISQFITLCSLDTSLSYYVQKKGIKKFKIHAEYMFSYFNNSFTNSVLSRDLRLVHHKCHISKDVFERFRQKALQLIVNLDPDNIVLNDFNEEWDSIKPVICEEQNLFQKIGGMRCLEELSLYVSQNLVRKEKFLKIFGDNEINALSMIKNKIYFLTCGTKFYKRSDLIIIHQRLRITNSIFDEFIQTFRQSIDEINSNLLWLLSLLEQYREVIVSSE